MTLGQKLEAARLNMWLTRLQVERYLRLNIKLHIIESDLMLYETDHKKVPQNILKHLASLYGLPVIYFTGKTYENIKPEDFPQLIWNRGRPSLDTIALLNMMAMKI
jgi:hypothetical protein